MKESYYLFSSGTIQVKDRTLMLETSKGKRYLPVETVRDLHVFGEIDLNTRLLNFLTQQHIPLHVYNYYGYYAGSYMPREQYVSGCMTLEQANHYMDPESRQHLARKFVQGSMQNILKVLTYYSRRGKPNLDVQNSIEQAIDLIPQQNDIPTLMALEGNTRATYYQAWDNLIGQPEFRFERRSKRPPENHLNALISLGNSMMYVTCLSEIYRTHLDPRIGFLHTTNHRRYSLNLDIAEIFKPIIVDRLIFTLLNKNMIRTRDFESGTAGIFLTEQGRQTFIRAYDERLKQTLNMPRLKRHISYRRLIRMELYKLEKHLLGDETYQPYTARW